MNADCNHESEASCQNFICVSSSSDSEKLISPISSLETPTFEIAKEATIIQIADDTTECK